MHAFEDKVQSTSNNSRSFQLEVQGPGHKDMVHGCLQHALQCQCIAYNNSLPPSLTGQTNCGGVGPAISVTPEPTRKQTHTHTRAQTPTHTHTHSHTQTDRPTHTHTHTSIHARTHPPTHPLTHPPTHTHTPKEKPTQLTIHNQSVCVQQRALEGPKPKPIQTLKPKTQNYTL
jgi:hypothetical protein